MAAGKHLVLATIIEVHPGQVTYPACLSCYTKLHHLSTSNKFQCQRCGRLYEVNEVHHRYRLTVKVTSQSACREVTLFGSCLDPFFGTDATAFTRYVQHVTQYHQTTPSEFDILHASITSTLVGHPFYFGFKTAGNFSVQKCSHTTSCVSLANITGRDSEGLVAVQLTSPFQKWNFPTVLQNLCRIIASREGQLNEQGGFAQCSNRDGCEICTLMALPQNQTAEKVNLGHVTTDHLGEGGAGLQEIVDSTCSRSDESCGTNYSLGETFFSSSISSFRLSCDKTLPTFNKTLHSRLSDGAINAQNSRSHEDITTPGDCAGCSQNVENDVLESLHTNDDSVSHQESSRHESGSVNKSASSTGKSCTNLKLQECVITGDLSSERCQKKDSCINIVSHTSDDNIHGPRGRIEDTTDNQSTTSCRKSCKATATDSTTIGHEQDPATFNDSSIIQECEQFMNQWLEENSFDRWSYYESRSCVPHSNSPSHGNRAVMLQTRCMEESREQSEADGSCRPELSHSCAESLDDLPFSEDLNQFLHDVEEEYTRSKDKELRDLSLRRMHEVEGVRARINEHEKDVTAVSTFGRSAKEEKSAESYGRKPRLILLRRKVHREVDERVRTDGFEKEVTIRSDKFIRLKCNGADISQPCDKDRDLCTCDVGQSCGNELKERHPLSESDSIKRETELCNVSEQEYEGCPELGLKCNISEEGVYSLQHDEVADFSVAEGKQLGEFIYDDVGDDSIFSNISVQDEQVQSDSALDEDYNQSPLLFSQSQSPIWPVRPSSYLTAQQPRSRFMDDDNSLPIQHKATPTPRRGSNRRVPKPNRKSGALSAQNRTESENMHRGRQIRSQGTPDRRVDVPNMLASQKTGDKNSPHDMRCLDQGTPCLFSQALPDTEIPSYLSSLTGNSRRAYRGKQKATPLRQLFLQRARFWNMSSTPMPSKEKSIAKVEQSFESPLSSGTPNLFSSENSLTGDDTSWNSDQGKLLKDSFQKEVSNGLECTPDLF